MKKILYVFVMLIAFSACENDYEYTFDKTPTERKTEGKAELTNLLADSEFGWKTTIVVHGDQTSAGDYFVMKFEPFEENNNGEVTVANGFDSHTSEFEINFQTGCVLKFNTYNDVFHWLTKPNGWEGEGFGSDQEFIFMREEGGKLIFQGKEKKKELILEPATEQDWDMTDIQNNYDRFMEEFSKNFIAIKVTKGLGGSEENPFYAKFNNEDVYITRSAVPEKEGFFYMLEYIVDGEKVYGHEASYVFTPDEIILSEPVVLEGDTLDRIVYNEESDIWEVANEGIEGYLESSYLPLMPSPGAVDNLVNIFLMDDYGWEIDPWNYGDEGKMEEFAEGIYYDCEMFDWFILHGDFINPDGEHLGAGFELQGDDYGDTYAFVPVEFVELAESEMKFVLTGEEITTNIEGAEEVIATDPYIQDMLNAFCNEKGWSIFCSSYFYSPTWELFPYEFYNMEDPTIVLKNVWDKNY